MQRSHFSQHLVLSGLILVSATCFCFFAAAQEERPKSLASKKDFVLREGTNVEFERVICENRGERLVLEIPETHSSYIALENLAAQRILEALVDNESDRYWSCTGSLTEFRGKNFLMLKRVRRAAKVEE